MKILPCPYAHTAKLEHSKSVLGRMGAGQPIMAQRRGK